MNNAFPFKAALVLGALALRTGRAGLKVGMGMESMQRPLKNPIPTLTLPLKGREYSG